MIRKILIPIIIIFITLFCIYVLKLIFFKPFSFNHFLARQFIVNTLNSPESLTYIGLFEKYGYRSYNGKLSDYSLEKDIKDLKKKYDLNEIIKGDSIFCATGITSGDLVAGIEIQGNDFFSETLVTHKSSGLKKVIKLKQNL